MFDGMMSMLTINKQTCMEMYYSYTRAFNEEIYYIYDLVSW